MEHDLSAKRVRARVTVTNCKQEVCNTAPALYDTATKPSSGKTKVNCHDQICGEAKLRDGISHGCSSRIAMTPHPKSIQVVGHRVFDPSHSCGFSHNQRVSDNSISIFWRP